MIFSAEESSQKLSKAARCIQRLGMFLQESRCILAADYSGYKCPLRSYTRNTSHHPWKTKGKHCLAGGKVTAGHLWHASCFCHSLLWLGVFHFSKQLLLFDSLRCCGSAFSNSSVWLGKKENVSDKSCWQPVDMQGEPAGHPHLGVASSYGNNNGEILNTSTTGWCWNNLDNPPFHLFSHASATKHNVCMKGGQASMRRLFSGLACDHESLFL